MELRICDRDAYGWPAPPRTSVLGSALPSPPESPTPAAEYVYTIAGELIKYIFRHEIHINILRWMYEWVKKSVNMFSISVRHI